MSRLKQFIFSDYSFSETDKKLIFTYKVDDEYTFKEELFFDFDFVKYNKKALNRAIQLAFFMSGISYCKAFLPEEIVVEKGQIDAELAKLLSETYQEGLGEFFYVNNLDPNTKITFPVTTDKPFSPIQVNSSGSLVSLGGGKDSLLTTEILKTTDNVATWSLGHKDQLQPLVERVGLKHYWVERHIDKQLIDMAGKPGVYNGHIPISAIFAVVGTLVNILTGTRYHVVSNESSASEPTLKYKNKDINHQFSKSHRFEIIFKSYLNHIFGETVSYYSLLRPLTELYIAELFIKNGFDKYKDVFSSCNRAFVQSSSSMSWCGTCPKCAFVYVTFAPFLDKESLDGLFSGRDLLSDPLLKETYEMLIGATKHKPLECVGTISENRKAMELVARNRPELNERFTFKNEPTYDYRVLANHSIPEDFYDILQSSLKRLQ